MINKLAELLFRRVYHPIIALICADKHGQITYMELVDALFAHREKVVVPDAESIYLIFSHPDGQMKMTTEEIAVLEQIESQAPNSGLSVYLYNEDDGLLRVDRRRNPEYNDENVI